jgi:hypothetical protein
VRLSQAQVPSFANLLRHDAPVHQRVACQNL